MTVESAIISFTPLIGVLYLIEIIFAFTIVYCLGRQLVIRYKRGYMNAFFVALCFMMFFLGMLITTFAVWRSLVTLAYDSWLIVTLWFSWFFAHLGLAASLGFVAFFVINNSFKLYITSKEEEPKPIIPEDTGAGTISV